MGITSLIIVAILYLITAVDYYRKKDPGMTIVFIAYALANLGLIINLWKHNE